MPALKRGATRGNKNIILPLTVILAAFILSAGIIASTILILVLSNSQHDSTTLKTTTLKTTTKTTKKTTTIQTTTTERTTTIQTTMETIVTTEPTTTEESSTTTTLEDTQQTAECLNSNRVKLFVSDACMQSRCKGIQDILSPGFEQLDVINCDNDANQEECDNAKDKVENFGFPLWYVGITGEYYPGATITRIKTITGC